MTRFHKDKSLLDCNEGDFEMQNEIKIKTEEKLNKIKETTKLFNKILEGIFPK